MLRKHYVGFSWKVLSVQSEAEAEAMKYRPYLDLRRRIRRTDTTHDVTAFLG